MASNAARRLSTFRIRRFIVSDKALGAMRNFLTAGARCGTAIEAAIL